MNHISVWNQLVQLPYLNLYSKLVNAALELDVFLIFRNRKLWKILLRRWDGIQQIRGIFWVPCLPWGL